MMEKVGYSIIKLNCNNRDFWDIFQAIRLIKDFELFDWIENIEEAVELMSGAK